MSLLADYTALKPSAPRPDVSRVLQAIIDAPPFGLEESARKQLVQTLLDDLVKLKKGKESGRLSSPDAAQALSALKSLGRNRTGAKVLASAENLIFLLSLSEQYKDNTDVSCEALRCVANTMLLIEEARATAIGETVRAGDAAVQLLEKSSSPDLIFLASRILFLSTASSANAAGKLIISFVEDKPASRNLSVVEIIALRLDSLLVSLLAGTKMARDAMTDLLKFTYNLLAHYPKLADSGKLITLSRGDDKTLELWSDRLDPLLPALLRAFNTLPPPPHSPIAPPLMHVIHGLIAIPITSSLRPIWFPPEQHRSASGSRRTSPTQTPRNLHDSPKESRPGALDRALNILAASRRSLSSRPSSPIPSISLPPPLTYDTVQRAIDLFDVALVHYFPGTGDPDDASVRSRARDEADATIDELLAPITLLCEKLASADPGARAKIKEWLVPANLDRSKPLEGRPDALGRLLRVLQSVYHSRLKVVVGELLFTMCNSDSMQLIQAVGYGNVAGFLFNKGIVTGPPDVSADVSGGGLRINPITGAVQEPYEEPEMTEEEREEEAERLFVLFDRLERSGAIPPSQNLVRRAIAEGHFG
ncbi:guanine nucleotide exchange factor [Vararia minispora EC-137]|uniref:Guanine nucleotide exchange factor n=1 Tax=Vararia minispora EC-137 TaxID=1314806 RepID=A0ACB8QD05_9AGAM|nr:guanine nucleotide exchange factor [Vararia minispora EC-137]